MHGESVATVDGLCWPPSHCVHCLHPIAVYDNVPLLSFFWLRGRCRACHQAISWQYPAVEFLSAVCGALCYAFWGASMAAVWALVFCWSLIVASGIDVRTQCLPDEVTWPLMLLGLVLSTGHVYVNAQDAALGLVLGYYSLWVVHWLFKLLTKKDGFGYGDFKLMAALGSWLGWKCLPLLIFLSATLGLAVSLLCFLGRTLPGRSVLCTTGVPRLWPFLNIQVPFGPYLAFSGVAFLFLNAGSVDLCC